MMAVSKRWRKYWIEKFCSEIGVVERILHYYKGGDDNSGKEIEFIKCKSYKTFLTY